MHINQAGHCGHACAVYFHCICGSVNGTRRANRCNIAIDDQNILILDRRVAEPVYQSNARYERITGVGVTGTILRARHGANSNKHQSEKARQYSCHFFHLFSKFALRVIVRFGL